MNRIIYLIIFAGLSWSLFSCEETVDFRNDQQMFEALTSSRWISQEFNYEGVNYDSIELLAQVIDTIDNSFDIMYPGDEFRAVIWLELEFTTDQFFYNSRKNISYFKCTGCLEFREVYNYSEDTFGRFFIDNGILRTQLRDHGEWRDAGDYTLEFIDSDLVRIQNWVTIPLSTDSVQIDVTHINGIEAESRDYVFDVLLRAEE